MDYQLTSFNQMKRNGNMRQENKRKIWDEKNGEEKDTCIGQSIYGKTIKVLTASLSGRKERRKLAPKPMQLHYCNKTKFVGITFQ